jgi:hypothetical protein
MFLQKPVNFHCLWKFQRLKKNKALKEKLFFNISRLSDCSTSNRGYVSVGPYKARGDYDMKQSLAIRQQIRDS